MDKRREALANELLSLDYVFDMTTKEIDRVTHCCDRAVLHIIKNDNLEASIPMIKAAAEWFDIPHADGTRDLQDTPDFLSIRLVSALYEKECYNKLPADVKESLKRFFTERNYASMHGSENHGLMFRVSRLLAAQFYIDKYFPAYGMSGQECYEKDLQYVNDFLNFRAGRGWGEFDCLGYGGEIILILATLHKYINDPALKRKSRMAIDIILLDMIGDSIGYLYGGAHGRSYPNAIIDREDSEMARLYRYYFGTDFYEKSKPDSVNVYLSDYEPSKIVCDIAKTKFAPFENRERKHLHCMSAWADEIRWDNLAKVTGSINKYTYVCEDYALGAINHQDDYPHNLDNADATYAHHQQHEWELTLPNSQHKIFSHHYGIPSGYSINNRWTGDWMCCCGSYFANKNTAIAMHNIENKDATDIINAFCPLDAFDEKILEGKYLFLSYGELYISLYFDNGYAVNNYDDFANRELISKGRQNAVVLRVAYKNGYDTIKDFANSIKSMPVIFNRDSKTVTFDNIIVTQHGNMVDGKENEYPYPNVYENPFMKSLWDSKIIEVTLGKDTVIYDFINNEIRSV